jgi:hypothetical protein
MRIKRACIRIACAPAHARPLRYRVPHVGEQGSWGATRDEKIVVRRGGAWIILKLGRYSVARRGGAARNKFRAVWRGLLKKIQRRIQTKIYGTCICGGSDF